MRGKARVYAVNGLLLVYVGACMTSSLFAQPGFLKDRVNAWYVLSATLELSILENREHETDAIISEQKAARMPHRALPDSAHPAHSVDDHSSAPPQTATQPVGNTSLSALAGLLQARWSTRTSVAEIHPVLHLAADADAVV
jgi:hypothetical protein